MLRPKGDKHFAGKKPGAYQGKALALGMGKARRHGLAIDMGAHIGLMSIPMSKVFDKVIAFEPIQENYDCLVHNVPDNVTCLNIGLGAREETRGADNSKPSNSGGWRLEGEGEIPIITLDSLELDVDFIKLDIQGMEMEALEGARDTILRCHPVLMVEMKSKQSTKEEKPALTNYIMDLGYTCAGRERKDKIWV